MYKDNLPLMKRVGMDGNCFYRACAYLFLEEALSNNLDIL
jgi:hypothetical protein